MSTRTALYNDQLATPFKPFSIRRLTLYSSIGLLLLVFLSKVSLKWSGLIPRTLPPIFFQYGMHPFINFGLNFIIFIGLLIVWNRSTSRTTAGATYSTYLYLLLGTLIVQTFFQISLVNVSYSASMQLAGVGMAFVLITLYSVILPSLLSVETMVCCLKWITLGAVILSLLLLPVAGMELFRGGRFIGIFKHIPHMVSTSTFAFILLLPDIFAPQDHFTIWRKIFNIFALLLATLAVILTSTKAAFVTIIVAFLAAIIVFSSKRKSIRLFKVAFLTLVMLGVILFGVQTARFLYEITTGQRSFGMRSAQNGIETRLDEVYRGIRSFNQSPYFGKGLMYKFMGGQDKGIKVTGYNSFKDPHNLFVSAGVIGGWPLFILSIIGYLLMIFGTLRGLNDTSPAVKVCAIFLLSHLPVFIIYHAHFSLGGIGDRIYWLIFGYLGRGKLS
ncbi:MAG: O-antigen ligase family protein [Bdellovibrionales bacterium]|jgi:hypothetical protein|nr:O-antigen ligase family protein [Bdellovibrionales bacterium]MBT3525306.1 O-antigen ligase family protein [Bdellovibrionales bacterium]MBT7668547.1 O-antigen ligase family protein [Bdellovibrionales bacterium]MBT7766152.1 O-antigen ligase family protein [Bdellovibrionales bacterium]